MKTFSTVDVEEYVSNFSNECIIEIYELTVIRLDHAKRNLNTIQFEIDVLQNEMIRRKMEVK